MRRFFESQTQRIVRYGLLHGVSDMRRRTEVPVRRDESVEPLVWTLEVVVVDVDRETLLTIDEVAEDRPTQKLVPQRLPKPLHFAERLWVLGTTPNVIDTLALQRFLECGLASPGCVLPPVVRQNLSRRPKSSDPTLECLHDELASLVVRHRVAHDEARVVVHESCQVKPLVASEQKREDVRLPELVRLRPLESPRPVLSPRRAGFVVDETLLVENPPDLRLTDPERLEAPEHVPNPSRPVLGVLLSKPHHSFSLRARRRAKRASDGFAKRSPRYQPVNATRSVELHPPLYGLARNPEDLRQGVNGCRPLDCLPDDSHPQLHRVRVARPS